MHSSSRPAGEREHARHLMVRMCSSDTAGLCDGWGKGKGGEIGEAVLPVGD